MGGHVVLSLLAVSCILLLCTDPVDARIYDLELKHERRRNFVISSFGLLRGGHISILVSKLVATGPVNHLGFSVRQASEQAAQHIFEYSTECIFDAPAVDPLVARITLEKEANRFAVLERDIPLQSESLLNMGIEPLLNGSEVVFTVDKAEGEGLYTIAFHICSEPGGFVNAEFKIVEVNPGPDYLGAGKALLPSVYAAMAGAFFVATCCWMYVLYVNRNSSRLFFVHFLMLAVIFTKFCSLCFKGLDYHFIKTEGAQEEGWAIIYYIIFTTKGVLLFLTVLLIGAGFGFIKHALSDREKQVLLLVIPLQVFSNVMTIMLEETAEGTAQRNTFRTMGLLVDLVCCGAVLLVMNWARKHLSETAQRDDKAAASLRKQRLFRRFYLLVVGYIYITRVVVVLIESTITFPYEWLGAFINECVTIAFYTFTGHMFSPLEDNPYLAIPDMKEDEDAIEMEPLVSVETSTTSNTSGLRKVNRDTVEKRKSQETV